MNQRCVFSCVSRQSIVTVCLMMACIGCSKPPMFHIMARDEQPIAKQQFKIFLQGRELGTVTGSSTFEFDAEGRRGDSFENTQPQSIEARIPWVCGWVKTDSSLHLAEPDEIERARAEQRAVRATLSITYMPPAFDWVNIFIDNRGGPPQTVSIGELQEQVPAGATQRIMLPHSGGCDKANDVRLNGAVVAPVDIHKTLLIDVAHSHCYREEWSGYGFDDSGHGKTVYQARPFQLLNDNPDFFMEPLPGSVTTSDLGATRSVLKDVACTTHAR
jgi:hypothetical protein